MRLKICILFLIGTSFLVNCKNKKTTIKKIAKIEIPQLGFDSIDWKSDFPKISVIESDIQRKKQISEKFFNDFWKFRNLSGGLLVAQNGEIIFEEYTGFLNLETKKEMTAETPLHIASISKVLTGFAVLKLIEKGKLKLETTVNEIFPDFPYENLRVQDLLNHRSGLPDYMHFTDDTAYWDRNKIIYNKDVLEILSTKKPEAIDLPDKHFSYCNTNYVVLALIIEKITGLAYPDAMKLMVFDPLGMTNTYVFDYDKDIENANPSYYYNGKIWQWDYLDATYGDKNIYSTPRDLLKMDIAMYSDEFLPEELKEKAWKGYSYEKKGVKNYGLGIRLLELDSGKILYHNGWWHGNNSVYARDPDSRATVIALGNKRSRNVYTSFRLIGLFDTYPEHLDFDSSNREKSGSDSIEKLNQEIIEGKSKSDSLSLANDKIILAE